MSFDPSICGTTLAPYDRAKDVFIQDQASALSGAFGHLVHDLTFSVGNNLSYCKGLMDAVFKIHNNFFNTPKHFTLSDDVTKSLEGRMVSDLQELVSLLKGQSQKFLSPNYAFTELKDCTFATAKEIAAIRDLFYKNAQGILRSNFRRVKN